MLFVKRSVYTVSARVLHEPVVLSNRVVRRRTDHSVGPLVPVSTSVSNAALFVRFAGIVNGISVAIGSSAGGRICSSSISMATTGRTASFSVTSLTPKACLLRFAGSGNNCMCKRFVMRWVVLI